MLLIFLIVWGCLVFLLVFVFKVDFCREIWKSAFKQKLKGGPKPI